MTHGLSFTQISKKRTFGTEYRAKNALSSRSSFRMIDSNRNRFYHYINTSHNREENIEKNTTLSVRTTHINGNMHHRRKFHFKNFKLKSFRFENISD